MSDLALDYISDAEPGIRRRGRTRFRYESEIDGEPVRDEAALARIRALAIPPAWTDVWIAPDDRGHIQATGRDAKGRKQYRYHPDWHAHRNQAKYESLADFGHALGPLRARVDEDLGRRDLSIERVVALVVALLDLTAVRIGNEEYARENKTFGLTTLRARHAQITSGSVTLKFKAKHGKVTTVSCANGRIARVAKRCQDLPGQLLFQYLDDDGEARAVRSADVNEYLREVTGLDATAKTFRTWEGSVKAGELLAAIELPSAQRARQRALNEAIGEVAGCLGNTAAVCRSSYVHPRVVERWEHGELADLWAAGPSRAKGGVEASERKLLHLLEADRPSRQRRPA
ncbi:MAG: DNA topoisomerase IB [Acidimicrobiales bacterium]